MRLLEAETSNPVSLPTSHLIPHKGIQGGFDEVQTVFVSTMKMVVFGIEIMELGTVAISGKDGQISRIGKKDAIDRVFGQMVGYEETEMLESNFEELLSQVYSWWPSSIGSSEDSNSINIGLEDIEKFYESEIAPAAKASGSQLLAQLDWIVYGAVCSVLKVARVVRVDELRRDYVKGRFHHLLLTVGVRQLRHEAEVDGSFDLAELAAYLKFTGLHSAN